MIKITEKYYRALHRDSRGTWTTERTDWPNWSEVREDYIGKRTMVGYENGTVLHIEGISFEIVPNPA